MAGVGVREVADLLGHRTMQMVMRYAHLAPDHMAAMVERLVSSKPTELPRKKGRRNCIGAKRG